METIPIKDAEQDLERLIERAARGERVVIESVHGTEVQLAPVTTDAPQPRPRQRGVMKGQLQVPARLFEPMSEEELAMWYGAPS